MDNPAVGKILGMVMAYAVSSLGLLLAYYNYRKRVVKAEKIFTPLAWTVVLAVIGIALIGLIGGAFVLVDKPFSEKIAGTLLPGLIFAISFWVTWALYQNFVKKIPAKPPEE